jgi:hypothetical protein
LSKLDRERDNLLLALGWAPEKDDAVLGLRLTAALHHYWFLRAMPAVGAQVTRVALERPGAQAHCVERCRALVTAGWMCTWASADTESVRHMEEALRLARGLPDAATLCLVLTKFAHVRYHRNESDDVQRLTSEALAVGRTLGDCVELGDALVLRAHVHARCGQRESARSLFNEALALRRRMNHPSGIISVHLSLASMAVDDDSPDDARPHLDDAFALIPLADSQTAALHLLGATAQWAAIAGRHDFSVFLAAACNRQLDRASMRNELKPRQVERLERSRLALDNDTRDRLEIAGRALTYEQALQAMADLLKGRQCSGLNLPEH